jgi:hypothetical protein
LSYVLPGFVDFVLPVANTPQQEHKAVHWNAGVFQFMGQPHRGPQIVKAEACGQNHQIGSTRNLFRPGRGMWRGVENHQIVAWGNLQRLPDSSKRFDSYFRLNPILIAAFLPIEGTALGCVQIGNLDCPASLSVFTRDQAGA